MKSQIKRALAAAGLSLHRIPPGIIAGFDLGRDLALALGSKPGLVCIDVGAHVGTFVDLLKSSLKDPVIHAFEPAPESFASLRTRHAATPGVTLVNAGLGNEDGTISFNIFDNQTLNSFLPMLASGSGTLGGPTLVQTISVPIRRLDEYAETEDIGQIDLLKIDTQGYELKILKGAEGLLAAGKVRAVLLELNFVPLYDGQVWAHEVIGYLHERGFCLVDFYEKCRLNPHLGWCTALFTIRKALPR